MMRKSISAAKVNLLCRLPVPVARRCLQRVVCDRRLQGDLVGDKQLLIDVSVIISNDARTGIQRVVRALLLQLLSHPPAGCRVRPVFATRNHGYRYAPDHFGLPGAAIASLAETIAVTVGPDDLYLGLDLAAHLLPLHRAELAQWKRVGAEIHVIVYDLLPVLHPHWFNPKTTRNFHRWLKTIAIFADSIICISNTVKAELDGWLRRQHALSTGAIPVNTIPLGADIQSSAPSRGLPDNIDQLLSALASKPTLLMVGTLEPRKGHSQVLAAVESLWQQGRDINLVIVGKPGWHTEALQQILRSHPQNQHRLHWLDNASDEFLELLYTASTGVIVASQAEGYGLPVVEAMHYNKPVLARDIPIFREIAGDKVTFFSGTSPDAFLAALTGWVDTFESVGGGVPAITAKCITWRDSCEQLLRALEKKCAHYENVGRVLHTQVEIVRET